MKRAMFDRATDARIALELFDLAAELMQRVPGSARTRRAAEQIARRCIAERNRQLDPFDLARSQTSPTQGPTEP